ADNLDTLAQALFSVGKAAAAYQALRLAQSFLDVGSAAKTATAQVVAMTAATQSAAAAGATAATGVGRFASILSGLKAFTLAG
ncbi:hypothetical protein, partial [Streptococcus agalactiae]|uniref:hypothetical protein n=1 Tax=Streptococcus agalactiae TaxID=1311 RepID=UPI00178C7FF5